MPVLGDLELRQSKVEDELWVTRLKGVLLLDYKERQFGEDPIQF